MAGAKTRSRHAERLLGKIEVENDDPLQAGNDDGLHLLVNRVWQVGITRLGTVKGHDEAMRVAIVEALRRIVGAEIEIQQSWNLPDHALHRAEAFGDLIVSDFWFELEASVVFDLWHGSGVWLLREVRL